MPLRNPEARRAYHRKWRAAWRKANPEKNREEQRQNDKKRASSPKRLAKAREYYAKHRAVRIAYAKKQRRERPEVYRAWRTKNLRRLALKARNYRLKRNREKLEIVAGIKSGPCQDCHRYFHPVCLDFDHREPSEKSFNISRAVIDCKTSVEEFKSEISKCDLVCACCHRLRTLARQTAREVSLGEV